METTMPGRKTSKTWVLVADASGARVFAPSQGQRMAASLEFELDGTTAQTKEIASDRPGRTFDSGGAGRHAKEPPTDPQRYAKFAFARELGNRLEDARKKRRFDQLIVVVPPQFLGDLRHVMSKEVHSLVVDEIGKDLSMFAPHELDEYLRDALRS